MANERQNANATTENANPSVVTLSIPRAFSVSGTVVSINSRMKDDKFKHDTKIVTVEELGSGKVTDVFITESQWREYGVAKIIYMGNIVTFSLEECIKGVTGYKELSDSVELTPHNATYSAFARCVETSTVQCYSILGAKAIDPMVIRMIMQSVTQLRMGNSTQSSNVFVPSTLG